MENSNDEKASHKKKIQEEDNTVEELLVMSKKDGFKRIGPQAPAEN